MEAVNGGWCFSHILTGKTNNINEIKCDHTNLNLCIYLCFTSHLIVPSFLPSWISKILFLTVLNTINQKLRLHKSAFLTVFFKLHACLY